MRLDAFLSKNRPGLSRSVWAKHIKNGNIIVNGKVVIQPSAIVHDEAVIRVKNIETTVQPIGLPVIYEDDNVIVVDKPAGILTHSKGALNEEWTVANFIKSRVKKSDLPNNNRFGIVHRLDRATSGVLIGAKNATTLKLLQKQFSERKVKKNYLALAEKAPKNTELRIDLPIARNPKKPASFRVDPKGKPAITDVKVMDVYNNGTALLELKPLTGRTHQLRVHLAYIGSPIIGDVIYGKADKRMYLHAESLEITIPNGGRKVFNAKIPKDFKQETLNE